MIHFRVSGISFSLPLLTLIMPFLAIRFGLRESMIPVLFSLGVHEAAHLVAAKLMHVEISEIRIMPFGGSARMENPYNLSPLRLIVTAAAGPFANLMLVIFCAAFEHWSIISFTTAAGLIRTNTMLMLFNLLPVLPLDGGRILFAVLSSRIRESSAMRVELWSGRVLCIFLAVTAAHGWLRYGKFNITLVLAAIFILSSEKDEKNALIRSKAERFRCVFNKADVILPVKTYQMETAMRIQNALELIRPGETAWFILTKNGLPFGFADSRSIVDFIVHGGAPAAAIEALPGIREHPGSIPGDRSAYQTH